MSSTLTQLVMVFNGSGYNAWAEKMMAYLDFQGLSMIVNGELDQPTIPTLVTIPGTATVAASDNSATIEARQEKADAWTMKDKQARGAIYIRLTPSIKSQVQAEYSETVWTNLKEKFGVAGLPVIYSDFKRAMSFQLSGNNPRPEISIFMEHFDRLESNNVTVSEFVKSMLFINSLPIKYDHLIAIMLQKVTIADIKPSIIADAVIAEWE